MVKARSSPKWCSSNGPSQNLRRNSWKSSDPPHRCIYHLLYPFTYHSASLILSKKLTIKLPFNSFSVDFYFGRAMATIVNRSNSIGVMFHGLASKIFYALFF
jgi:hypothetical protein